MTANHKEASLKIAHTNHADRLGALAKVQALLPLTGSGNPPPDLTLVNKARLGLEDCLASRRLDEASAADEEAARAALANATKNFDAQKVAFDAASLEGVGLNRRLVAAQQLEADAQRTLAEAEVEWIKEELRIAEEAYTKHAAEVFRTYLRVSECAEALKKRGVKIDSQAISIHFAYSAELELPIIGPASNEAAMAANPDAKVRYGKLLFNGGRTVMYQPKDDGLERDLREVISSESASGLARFAKVVTALVPGAKK